MKPKKHTRLVRCVAILLVLLTVFAIPASASPGVSLSVSWETKAPSLQGGLPTSALAENKWSFSGGARTITYRGGWSAGYVDSTGYSHFSYINSSDKSWLMKNTVDQWQSPAGAIGAVSLGVSPHFSGGHATGFGYEAPYAGTVRFSIDSATLIAGDGFAVFVNGEMVFPTRGGAIGEIGVLDSFYRIPAGATADSLTRAMEGYTAEVKSGDKIAFAVKRGGGVTGRQFFSPRVSYTSLASSMPGASEVSAALGLSYPLFRRVEPEKDSLLAWQGGYSYAYAPRGTVDFRPVLTEATFNRLSATEEKGSAYVRIRDGGASVCGLAPSAAHDMAVLYRVRYGGTAYLQCDTRVLEKDARYGYTVYRNGEAVAPTVWGDAAEIASKIYAVAVTGGDTLAFVISRAEDTADPVSPPLGVSPSVSYQMITDTVAVSGAAMAPADSLDVHFYVVAKTTFPTSDVGIYLFRERPADFAAARADAVRLPLTQNQNGVYRYTYGGIAAKEMTDTVFAVPYYRENGEEKLGAPYTFSVRDYLLRLYGEDARRNALISDLLAYGGAAQRYFGYRTDDPADAGLSRAQAACRTNAGFLYESDLALGAPNDRNPSASRVTAFSLLLESRIALRAYVDVGEGEKKVTVQFSASGRFTDAIDCPVENGAATLPGIPAAGIGHVYHMRIRAEKDGRTVYSPVVSYSVKSYAAHIRTLGTPEADAVTNLADAMLLYGYSALSYANSKEP